MKERSMEHVMTVLTPFLDDFDAIGRHGLAVYRERYPAELRLEHSDRSAASLIHDHMCFEAERLLAGQEDVRALDVRSLKLWLIGDQVVIRLKKMDEEGRARNLQTRQQRDFDLHRTLPGVPPAPTRVTLGYFPDRTMTEVIRVQVACPIGREIAWCAAIVPAEKAVAGERRWIDVTRQPFAL